MKAKLKQQNGLNSLIKLRMKTMMFAFRTFVVTPRRLLMSVFNVFGAENRNWKDSHERVPPRQGVQQLLQVKVEPHLNHLKTTKFLSSPHTYSIQLNPILSRKIYLSGEVSGIMKEGQFVSTS